MVRNLLQIIEERLDEQTIPQGNLSILNYIYKDRTDVNFDQALSGLRAYAN